MTVHPKICSIIETVNIIKNKTKLFGRMKKANIKQGMSIITSITLFWKVSMPNTKNSIISKRIANIITVNNAGQKFMPSKFKSIPKSIPDKMWIIDQKSMYLPSVQSFGDAKGKVILLKWIFKVYKSIL